jgi:hypothetical protein
MAATDLGGRYHGVAHGYVRYPVDWAAFYQKFWTAYFRSRAETHIDGRGTITTEAEVSQ